MVQRCWRSSVTAGQCSASGARGQVEEPGHPLLAEMRKVARVFGDDHRKPLWPGGLGSVQRPTGLRQRQRLPRPDAAVASHRVGVQQQQRSVGPADQHVHVPVA